ncbi:MAG: hypothetical protein ACO25B_02085 [Chitinophagaceae bacterium]
MKKQILYLLALGFIIILGCQKEESFELPNSPAEGSLQDDVSGDCLPKTVNGVYAVGQALIPTTNSLTVAVNVTKTGIYTISTDTVNGYFFRATGSFSTLGITNVTLRGNGTPITLGTNNFVVSFDSTFCDIQVTVTSPAAFTLAGAPNTCTTPVISGTYGKDIPLTASNTVTLNVNVTTAGNYNVSTATINGMSFSGSGTLALGAQTITLTGTGTPTTAGDNIFPVTVGSSTCSFTITVAAPGVGTLGGAGGACTPFTINGTYTPGTPLTASNTVGIQVNVTTAGVFSIRTDTVGGMSFAYTGTLAAGTQNVTLLGSGTPVGSGAQNFTVTVGTSTCTFSINLGGPGVGTLGGAGGTCTPATVNGTYVAGTALTAGNTVGIQVNVTTAGSFNITTNTVNGYSFSFTGNLAAGTQPVTLTGTGTPTAAGTNVFTVTINATPPSTCTFSVVCTAPAPVDYFPRTTNSNWSYEFNDLANDSLYRVVIAPTLTAPGGTYNIFMANDGTGLDSSGYYRKSAGDYFEWIDIGNFVGFDNTLWGQYIMVKDNVAAGTNWKSSAFSGTVTSIPITIRFSYTVTDKDVPLSFVTSTGNQNFTNVIVVEEKLEGFDGSNWIDLTAQIDYYGKSYYARDIGLVKFEAYNAANAVTFKQELRRYQVF